MWPSRRSRVTAWRPKREAALRAPPQRAERTCCSAGRDTVLRCVVAAAATPMCAAARCEEQLELSAARRGVNGPRVERQRGLAPPQGLDSPGELRNIPCAPQKPSRAAKPATHRVSVPGKQLRVPVVVLARRRRSRQVAERRRSPAAVTRVACAAARCRLDVDGRMQSPHRCPTAAPGPGATATKARALAGLCRSAGAHTLRPARSCEPHESRSAMLPSRRATRGHNALGALTSGSTVPLFRCVESPQRQRDRKHKRQLDVYHSVALLAAVPFAGRGQKHGGCAPTQTAPPRGDAGSPRASSCGGHWHVSPSGWP